MQMFPQKLWLNPRKGCLGRLRLYYLALKQISEAELSLAMTEDHLARLSSSLDYFQSSGQLIYIVFPFLEEVEEQAVQLEEEQRCSAKAGDWETGTAILL